VFRTVGELDCRRELGQERRIDLELDCRIVEGEERRIRWVLGCIGLEGDCCRRGGC